MTSQKRPEGPLTKRERDKIREGIVKFCAETPRTLAEINAEFGISGISAGGFLSNLCRNHVLVCDWKGPGVDTYVKVKKKPRSRMPSCRKGRETPKPSCDD